ncbi:hypothetical protein J4418_02000 [Candidatus Woesearchaeota archaeon]|nr:hypothetical protein [Candidatus Woesearchaeota archaeon]
MNTKQRVQKLTEIKRKSTIPEKRSLKTGAYENPDRDDDLKEYLNRKEFHPFELELLMDDFQDEEDLENDESWA